MDRVAQAGQRFPVNVPSGDIHDDIDVNAVSGCLAKNGVLRKGPRLHDLCDADALLVPQAPAEFCNQVVDLLVVRSPRVLRQTKDVAVVVPQLSITERHRGNSRLRLKR